MSSGSSGKTIPIHNSVINYFVIRMPLFSCSFWERCIWSLPHLKVRSSSGILSKYSPSDSTDKAIPIHKSVTNSGYCVQMNVLGSATASGNSVNTCGTLDSLPHWKDSVSVAAMLARAHRWLLATVFNVRM